MLPHVQEALMPKLLSAILVSVTIIVLFRFDSACAEAVLDVVSFRADDGVQLNAHYWRPREKNSTSILVLVPGHIGSIMGTPHDYRPLAEKLSENGYAFLLPQLRSLNNWPYAIFDDVAADIGGAMTFAKAHSYTEAALFGTSLGGPRISFFMAKKSDPSIRAIGFINSILSPYLALQLSQSKLDRERFDWLLAKARNLIVRGRGDDLVEFRDYFPGQHMAMTARSFISFNGRDDESNASTIKFASQIRLPTLVIHGTVDPIALTANATGIYNSLTGATKRDLIWVEGAGHFLEHGQIAKTYAMQITRWLTNNMPAK
jgi:esterase/lipase